MNVTYEAVELSLDALLKLKPAMKFEPYNMDALIQIIDDFGIVRPVFVQRSTWQIINPLDVVAIGLARERGIDLPDKIPVIVMDSRLDQKFNQTLAIILNGGLDHWLLGQPEPITMMQVVNFLMDIHPQLLCVLGPDLDYFQTLFDKLAGDDTAPEPDEPQPRYPATPHTIKQANLTLDIPQLDPDLQIMRPAPTFTAWGQHRRGTKVEALHFYVDDYRFAGLLSNPDHLYESGATDAIEINPSSHEDQPGALFLADLWKRRKLSQIWQTKGIRIAVDLNVSNRFLETVLIGVPRGWTAYANRAYINDLDHLDTACNIAAKHAGCDPLYFVYAGGDEARELCQKRGWIWIGDWHDGQAKTARKTV